MGNDQQAQRRQKQTQQRRVGGVGTNSTVGTDVIDPSSTSFPPPPHPDKIFDNGDVFTGRKAAAAAAATAAANSGGSMTTALSNPRSGSSTAIDRDDGGGGLGPGGDFFPEDIPGIPRRRPAYSPRCERTQVLC